MSLTTAPEAEPIAAPVVLVPARPVAPPRSRWIAGPLFDGLFFLFPTISAFLFIACYMLWRETPSVIALLNGLLLSLGIAHYWGTWFFFLDRDNFQHYLKRPVVYFEVPVYLMVFAVGGVLLESQLHDLFGLPWFGFVNALAYIWVNFHLTRQNVGFVSFYRNKAGLNTPEERATDNWLLYSNALLLYFLGWYYAQGGIFLDQIRSYKIFHVVTVLLIFFAYWAIRGIVARVRSLFATGGKSWPHVAMIVCSLMFPLPLFFATYDPQPVHLMFSNLSYGLFAHYLQYLALVCLICWNKYPGGLPSPDSDHGAAAPSQPQLLFGKRKVNGFWVVVAFMVTMTILIAVPFYHFVASPNRLVSQIAGSLILGFGLIHFWHDGFVWRMSDEYNRKSLLSYIGPFRAGNRAAGQPAGRDPA